MRRRLLWISAVLLLALSALWFVIPTRSNSVSIPWTSDYEEAFQKARSQDQPVLAYIYTDWCTYCRQMEATTFRDETLIRSMVDDYEWLKLNAENDPLGRALQIQYQITSYPTILVMNNDEQEMGRIIGYVPSERFKQEIEKPINSPDSYGNLRRRVQENPENARVYLKLGEEYLERQMFSEAEEAFEKVLELDPQNHSQLRDDALYSLAQTFVSRKQGDRALQTLETLQNEFPQSDYLPDVLITRAEMYLYQGDKEGARDALESFLERFPNHRYVSHIRKVLESRHFSPAGLAASSH